MAANRERNQIDTEEGKIPVFTVLKNGAILKNIFIVNKPPEEPLSTYDPKSIASARDHEDILIIGRNPNCHIMLTHPSISRFHLQIRSKPSSLKLSVVDLSSVHGTWVSGRKLVPGESVDLKEGDTLRIGGSSRVYKLHWIPISLAYDMENPFVSKLDAAMEEKKRKEDAVPEEENVEVVQDEKYRRTEIDIEGDQTLVENEKFGSVDDEEIQSLVATLECINSLMPDEHLELTVKKEIQSAPPMVEEVISLTCDEEGKSPLKDDHQQKKTVALLSGNLPTISESENPPHLEWVAECDNVENSYKRPEELSDFLINLESQSCVEQEIEAYPEAKKPRETNILSSLNEYLTQSICSPVVEAVQGTKMQQFQDVINDPPDTFTSQLSPGKQEASFEKQWSSIINLDPASFDEKSAAEMSKETEYGCTLINDDRVKDTLTAEAGNLMTESSSLPVEEAILDTKFQEVEIVEEVAMYSLSDGEKQDKYCQENKSRLQVYLSAKYRQEQGHSMDEIVQDIDNKCTVGIYPISPPAESVDSSLPDEAVLEIKNKNENQLLPSLTAVAGCSEIEILESRVEATEKNLTFCNIWSREGKAASAPQIRTSKRVKGIANVDTEAQMSNEKDIVNKTISKDFSSVLNGEEEIFTPDRENFGPNTLQLRFLKKKGRLEEVEHSKSERSHNSKANVSANIYPDESTNPTSNKENQNLKVAHEQKPESTPFCSHIKLEQEQDIVALKKRVKRVPLQSLLMNSRGKSISETSGNFAAAKNINASNCGQSLDKQANPSQPISGERKRSWDMVVDTASLLNKESRKALQLLQGLKGTRLIIPRTVIRELDSMKQQFSMFRRTSEASLVMEWIEECMVKTKWWIHVQGSTDEGKLIALTQPATPQTQYSEERWTFPSGIGSSQPISFHKSSMEIVPPTDVDHILDCARLYRARQNDRQLVLLSDDITLKIKSMAEGLLCETVQEFRESLVNPFSERFLWAYSSPRGLTWSFQDDVVLREKYCRFPSRKSSKGEGLKLILLQNFQYGQISSDCLTV